MSTVGVLALQGDFSEHAAILKKLNAEVREVRLPSDLEGIDRLIIPGGESTTITRLMDMYGLLEPLRAFAAHRPVWGTCAGMIVMAKHATDLDRETLGLMDISVVRNAFGRQVDSFETDLQIDEVAGEPFHAVFIRAPLIKEAGPGVKVLAQIQGQGVVAARQGHLLVTSFHPELTDDLRLHAYFLTFSAGVAGAK
ncbi:MAG TPA: pyridoxal 5'-phosphate synthase glutaminase subunit PdxT [Dehalococcoidia bacterium]|nr:pyridoxal 5'-phosphate synthase glutaminase subunit PdxT [Dehalococcoidia bacterium]